MVVQFTPKQLGTLKKVARESKLKARADLGQAIELGGQVVSSVIDGIYAVKNEEERKRYADLIQELNEREASILAESLQKTTDNNEKIRAMAMFFSNYYSDKATKDITKNISSSLLGKSNQESKMIYIALGSVIALIGIVLVIKKLKK
jgi:hypothetical protein